MKRLATLFIVCCIVILSCSNSTGPDKTDPGDNNDGETKDSVTQTIGTSGGTIDNNDIVIDIPAGTFSDDVEILLQRIDNDDFDDDGLTDTFTLTGIPEEFSQPLEVRLKYSGDVEGDIHLALGMDALVKSVQEIATSYDMIPADYADGYISAVIQPTGYTGYIRRAKRADDNTGTVTVKAVNGYAPHVTSQGHFTIKYPPATVSQSSVEKLGTYLEEAYSTYLGMGFSYSARTSWPVSVTVKQLKSSTFGYYVTSKLGLNHCFMEFNTLKMNDSDELRRTAGHEFFHLVQELYDPRYVTSRVLFNGPQLWLEEACAAWSEEKFTDDQNYISTIRKGHEMAPFTGMKPRDGAKEDYHGYGMSGMIKYLTGRYSESILEKMFTDIKASKDPVEAVINNTASPDKWWQEFIRRYAMGEIYGVEQAQILAEKSGMYRIATDTDTLHTFTDSYVDLSARMYMIRLDNSNFDDGAKVKLSVDSSNSGISVLRYRLNPATMEHLESGSSSVEIGNLKDMHSNGWHLLAIVTNHRHVKPYTGTSTINLEVKVDSPKAPEFNFNRFSFSSFLYGRIVNSDGTTSEDLRNPNYSYMESGTLTGNQFTSTFTIDSEHAPSSGKITCTFDKFFTKITSITFEVSTLNTSLQTTYTLEFEGVDFEYSRTNQGWREYKIKGDELTSPKLTSFHFRAEKDDWWRDMTELLPEDKHYIIIGFKEE